MTELFLHVVNGSISASWLVLAVLLLKVLPFWNPNFQAEFQLAMENRLPGSDRSRGGESMLLRTCKGARKVNRRVLVAKTETERQE